MYTVFFIDDEPWVLRSLRHMLDWNHHGFRICGEADNSKRALQSIDRLKPDLIISDIRMPELSGLELLESFNQKQRLTEVILISGYTDFEYARRAIAYSCSAYLVKPIDVLELTEALEKVKTSIRERRLLSGAIQIHGEGYVSNNRLVNKMIDYIRQNCTEPISLSVLSEQFQISESYVSNLIKKNTGKSFSEHLTNYRIQKARELLSGTSESIHVIAEEVGYSDYFYFTKVYKKITGISPSEYRKLL